MSETIISSTVAGIELSTNEQPQPVIPSWLGEVLLLGEYWRTTGLLDRLQTQVKVNRGRMGQYEVCDFVLLLLAYAVSGVDTLKEFFEQLKNVQPVVMSMWQRQQCPVASTVSRFMADIDSNALEQLRTLFEADLLEHGFGQTKNGGLIDRAGETFVVFDVDGTHQAVRQRTLTSTASRPPARRRSQAATAKGYLGRSRGEVTRTRSTVTQTHTSEWLGTFGAPGNGTPGEDLQRICGIIQHYLQRHKLHGSKAIVRLDGYYGTPKDVSQIQQYQLGYILRSRDYSLLQHPEVQNRLQAAPVQLWTHPEAHQVREVFDLGFIDDSWAGYAQPARLIVVRTPRDPNRKHRIGKQYGDVIYELFVTALSPAGLTACDILSLYYGRGGFEKMLGDEDVEQDCDRWCSWHPPGQEFWQILSQWVWNWRLWVGFANQPQPLRQTIWVPAAAEIHTPILPAIPTSPAEPLVLSDINAPCPAPDSMKHGPPEVAGGWARSLDKFSGSDFTILNDRTLQCPAGQSMYRREVRQNRRGDLKILFGINPRTCQQCPLKSQCLADGSKETGGRRITVIRKQLPLSEQPKDFQPGSVILPEIPFMPVATQSNLPVLWLDFPTTHLRRDLAYQLRHQQIVIESIAKALPLTEIAPQQITRDQRAHRRLTWVQRLDKNVAKDSVTHWKIQLFGISSAVLDWLSSLKPSPAVII